jgi:nucleoside diphosphate kinase
MKFMNVSKSLAERHYADLSSKPFFGGGSLSRCVRGGQRLPCPTHQSRSAASIRHLLSAASPSHLR